MPKALPQTPRRNAPWTPLQRRTWLAEQRRKEHLLPAPVIRPKYPDLIVWDWDLANPYKWNFWMSLNGGATYILIEDYWMYGDARQFAPDGGGELYYAVGVDKDGNEITQHSNIVRPDDAPVPPSDPSVTEAAYGWYEGPPAYADIEVSFSFNPGSYPAANVEIWASRDGGVFVLIATKGSSDSSFYYSHATENEAGFDFKVRYVNGATIGPFSNVLHLEVQAA
jgi:hypothetical protein